MKKVLTIAIVAMLATATLFAGVSFSGRFRQGYTFTFEEDEDPVGSPWKTEEAKLIVKFSDDNGLWTVNLKNVGKLDSNDKWAANATFNFTKALSLAGIDTGDFGLAISLGNNEQMEALTAYDDPTGDEYYMLKNNGLETIQLAMNYGKLVKFNIAVDPTKKTTTTKTAASTTYTITTESEDNTQITGTDYYIKTTTIAASETTTTDSEPSLVLSASTTPVDGVDFAVAYAHKAYIEDAYTADILGAYDEDYDGTTADNAIGFSAKADIAKLAGLDFALSVAAYDNILLGEDDAVLNSFAANVSGGIDMVDGFVEFRMLNVKDDDSYFGLKTQVNLNVVENLGLDAYFNIADLEEAGDTFSIGADATYDLAGVTFALNAEYAKAKKAFSLTPKMIIVF